MSWLYSILGAYVFDAFSLVLAFVENLICVIIFGSRLKKQRHFVWWISLSVILGVVACYFLAVLKTEIPTLPIRVLCYSVTSLLILATTCLCYQDTIPNELLCFCSGTAAYQTVGKLYSLIQNLLGINDQETISFFHSGLGNVNDWDWVIYLIVKVAMVLLLSAIFRPRKRLNQDKTSTRNVLLLSIATILVVNVLICIARVYEAESFALNIVVKLFCIGFGVVVMISCAGILSRSEKEHQLTILTQLWKQDQAQFESIKANMDVVQMKCHDLRRLISRIEGKLTEEEMVSFQEALQFYDANIKTGNKVLDVVLCEKAMLCQKNGIQLFCMADGEKIAFLTPVQTYTLFGNIVDNAVEAVQSLSNPENKIISLLCRESDGGIVIEASNYFEGDLLMEDELPATTKDNPSQHGFGIKSIKYIVEQYGGKLTVSVSGNMFFLKIHFPVQ